MDITAVIGSIAATLTTGSFGFQVLKILKTKQTQDISWMMYLILLVGVSLWLIYGIALNALPIIIANAVTLIFVIAVLILKYRFSKAAHQDVPNPLRADL